MERFLTWIFINFLLWVLVGILYLLACIIMWQWVVIDEPIIFRWIAVLIGIASLKLSMDVV
jgi:hypothetical protein